MTSPDEPFRRRALLQHFRRLCFMPAEAWRPSLYLRLKYRGRGGGERGGGEKNTHNAERKASSFSPAHTSPNYLSFPFLFLSVCPSFHLSFSHFVFLSVCLSLLCLDDWLPDLLCHGLKPDPIPKVNFPAITFSLIGLFFCVCVFQARHFFFFGIIFLFMSMAINCCQLFLMYENAKIFSPFSPLIRTWAN